MNKNHEGEIIYHISSHISHISYIIQSYIKYYLTPYTGRFHGVESVYKSISWETIGISKNQVAQALKTVKSKQILYSANQSILQPFEVIRVCKRLQIDLTNYNKSPIPKFNNDMNYVLTCTDCHSKFLGRFLWKTRVQV